MYCVGNLPDHVTRYNHKNQSRWMVMAEPPSRISFWGAVERVAMTVGFTALGGVLVTTMVLILQGVA
jgi:hypothetical protein